MGKTSDQQAARQTFKESKLVLCLITLPSLKEIKVFTDRPKKGSQISSMFLEQSILKNIGMY